jgi:hypothetical protein
MQSPQAGAAPSCPISSVAAEASGSAGMQSTHAVPGWTPLALAVAALALLGPFAGSRAAWFDGALVSLVSLAVLGTVLGLAATPVRMVAALGAGTATLLLARGDSTFHLGSLLVVWLAAIAARWLGLRLDSADAFSGPGRAPSRGQFSIADLGLATAVAAALLMVLRLLAEQPHAGGLGPRLSASCALCLLQIALTTSLRGPERAAVFSAGVCLCLLPLAPALGGLAGAADSFGQWRDREASTIVTTLFVLAATPERFQARWRTQGWRSRLSDVG